MDRYFPVLDISDKTLHTLKRFIKNNPLSADELNEILKPYPRNKKSNFDCSLAQSSNRYRQVIPTINVNPNLTEQRRSLPIYNYRQMILDVIETNQVTVISAETGAGKSTQVPQYLLEHYANAKKPCKIICTQPRRVAAIAVSQRVAQERNERIGLTIGYQIRLESQMSPMSNLIYTTTGYFLRCLVSGDLTAFFRDTTHLILDEIHERDKHSDFVLIAIKEHLAKHPNIRVILMSATIDSKIFSDYFNGCPIVEVPGRVFPVTVYHLEDVLQLTEFGKDRRMNDGPQIKPKEIMSNLDKNLMAYVNETLEQCWCSDDPSIFDQFFYLITGENVPIDIQHSDTELNALMIAASKGLPSIVSKLLSMGADATIVGGFNRTALQWANDMEQWQCAEIIRRFMESNTIQSNAKQPVGKLLEIYTSQSNEDEIDHDLLTKIIFYIHTKMPSGSILIFLPGYDDILEQKENILQMLTDGSFSNSIELFMLHSSMQVTEQRKVFQPLPAGIRKIILSTNIAETSITIDDVVYVIDSGKVKQKSFHALNGSTSLTSVWISKACAKQRTGRAGRTRPGISYRLFSQEQFNKMDEYTLPEILRVPLPEICLHAKILSINASIGEFLSNAIQPPPKVNIDQSINLLQSIGALDSNESVTELGLRLVDLPLDVQLGKALLYSVFFKCFDPILTIVSTLSVKDPFLLSSLNTTEKISISRKFFAEDTLSDHMVFLKLFKMWMEAKARGQERKFCRDAGISNGTMELICGTRSHILGCLRSHKIASNSLAGININSSNWAMVKACLTAGLYPNICLINKIGGQLQTRYEKRLMPHPKAVCRDFNLKRFKQTMRTQPNDWIVFGEKIRNENGCLIWYNTPISSFSIAIFCGPYFLPQTSIVQIEADSDTDDDFDDDDEATTKLIIDDFIFIRSDTELAQIVRDFRHKLNASFLKMLRDIRNQSRNKENDNLIQITADILKCEDEIVGLTQPDSVGYRPVAVKLCFGSDLNFGVQENVNSTFPSSNRETKVQYTSMNRKHHLLTDTGNATATASFSGYDGGGGGSVNSFQSRHKIGDQMFINSSRFFIIQANSKDDIHNSFRKGDWNFHKLILEQLLNYKSVCFVKSI